MCLESSRGIKVGDSIHGSSGVRFLCYVTNVVSLLLPLNYHNNFFFSCKSYVIQLVFSKYTMDKIVSIQCGVEWLQKVVEFVLVLYHTAPEKE